MRKIWSIPGGIHPEENKSQSLQLPLGEVALPSELIFPLSQHIGAPAKPIVTVGERVLAGQKIADAKGMISAAVHASTSGTVTAIEDRTLPHPSGLSGPCIVLAADGKDEFAAFEACEDYLSLDKAVLVQKIREAGIAGMGGAGFPTAVKLSPRANQPIDTLIINGTECEPYITADDILMQTQAEDIIKGTLLLAHILSQPGRIVIGIEDNKPLAIAAITQAAEGTPVEVVSFPTKYPSGGEKQLIQILTGKEVPSGALPSSIGIVLQNVGTTVAAYEAVRFGKPLIERITTVVGEALATQRNIRVRLGTPIHHVLAEHGFAEKKAMRLIVGGPMMGYALEQDDVPVVKTTNCILAPTKKEMPPPRPTQACIRCGMCAEACPASLLPQQMYWYAAAEEYDRLEAQNIMDCIECGACSYVCPSNIPLVQYYRAAKGTMRQMAIDKEKSDRSRKRFEFRQERIAKAEAEKEAKRLARKKAAELAKQKQEADKAAGVQPSGHTAKADIVATAMASAKAKQATPEEQKAKLERAVTSAEGRLEKLQQRHSDADGDMKERLAAQIKQAELKLQEAKDKLAHFTPVPTAITTVAADAPAATADPNDPVAVAIARAQAKMTMAPDEKLQANIVSLTGRLAKAEEKLAAAKAENSDKVDALQTGVDKLKEKIASAEQELAELTPSAPTATPAPEQDAAAAAIERAKAKAAAQANLSPEDKLRDQLTSINGRLEKARIKLEQAQAENTDTVAALQLGLDKMLAKQDKLRDELRALNPNAPELTDQPATAAEVAPQPAPTVDAATAAIEKAKAKADALASMSPEDKLRDQIASLETRLDKAKQRLAKAEAEDDPNLDAFKAGVEKTEAKLQQTKQQLVTSNS
ncbi:electron transport complex subunit RsxC [Aestuariicella hydrocarbonica]|uniref:Ion-translocating oxidoreductase complex subunit C n=1 Tax=Pseudomaricurvus hydrocarbonicus TaxID=1470433 RepID=A0A9E5JXY1_9GAMM|nr:electron transport complex subunit RsxC [Aestuariicella hydrocarbonica]